MKMETGKETSILQLFPDTYRNLFREVIAKAEYVNEIRMRAEKPIIVILNGKEYFLTKEGSFTEREEIAEKIEQRGLEMILNHICSYSIYAYEDEVRQGFLTVQGGHRIGVAGQAVMRTEREIKNMKYIRFLNIRISHQIIGAADAILPFIYEEGNICNTLLISMPGIGKTTLLRDMIRQVSGGNRYGEGITVGVVDERSELAGCFQGIAQNDLGIRTDILDACPKELGMMMLLRSMTPGVIAVDEIGGRGDEEMLRQITRCGVHVMATIHGSGMEDLKRSAIGKNMMEEKIFDRYIVLERVKAGNIKRRIYDKELIECFVC